MDTYKQVYEQLKQMKAVEEAITFLANDDTRTLEEQIVLAEIPAPPFKEEKRTDYIYEQLEQLGLVDVQKDEEGNVFGTYEGTEDGPTLFVSAHADSVFAEDVDTTVTHKEGTYYGAGITDDARGLAAMLSIVRAFTTNKLSIKGKIIFGATVGEEGVGDLRGVKAFFDQHTEVDGFISIDAVSPTEIIYLGTGSYRYEVTISGPGGHSFGAFGTPSALHVAAKAAAKLTEYDVTDVPKTTFNIGSIQGGTSPTAIAEFARMTIDLRSNGNLQLQAIDDYLHQALATAINEESTRAPLGKLTYTVTKIGDRPVGTQSTDAPIVRVAEMATKSLDLTPKLAGPASTDANHPIHLGVPALTLGAGGEAGAAHTLNEWYRPTNSYLGPQRVLYTILGLVGTHETESLLPRRLAK